MWSTNFLLETFYGAVALSSVMMEATFGCTLVVGPAPTWGVWKICDKLGWADWQGMLVGVLSLALSESLSSLSRSNYYWATSSSWMSFTVIHSGLEDSLEGELCQLLEFERSYTLDGRITPFIGETNEFPNGCKYMISRNFFRANRAKGWEATHIPIPKSIAIEQLDGNEWYTNARS